MRKEKSVDWETVQTVYELQLYVFGLQRDAEEAASESTKYRIEKEIAECEELLCELRKDLVYYRDAEPYENLEVLSEKFFRDLRRDLTEYEFDVAVLNLDPDKAIEPFYPDFSPVHLYSHPQ